MVSRATIEYGTSRTRDGIAYFVLAVATAFLAAAAAYGAYERNFDGLRDLWAVAGPITGAIIGYYFHRGRKD